ncbi:hypothetical protein M378DRAFT_627840 [Amanita muscaria Koide BX008]|uniref:Uncharacterized protein n=1 Tax=Amanita muscaria (strain Koide BX008) TaxID=946122 RepID=A0A0C2X4J2_AMAMK|nr:hypothetical protein M378DRAFT_627840 [Amanita muscaria Koide BX008]
MQRTRRVPPWRYDDAGHTGNTELYHRNQFLNQIWRAREEQAIAFLLWFVRFAVNRGNSGGGAIAARVSAPAWDRSGLYTTSRIQLASWSSWKETHLLFNFVNLAHTLILGKNTFLLTI